MAKKPVSSPVASFETVKMPHNTAFLAIPERTAHDIQDLVGQNGAKLSAQLNKLMERSLSEGAPIGKPLGSNLRFLPGNDSTNKETRGLVVLNAPHKDMPLMVLGTMSYGDYVRSQTKKGVGKHGEMARLSEMVTELMGMYPDRNRDTAKKAAPAKPAARDVKIPSGFKVYTAYGVVN